MWLAKGKKNLLPLLVVTNVGSLGDPFPCWLEASTVMLYWVCVVCKIFQYCKTCWGINRLFLYMIPRCVWMVANCVPGNVTVSMPFWNLLPRNTNTVHGFVNCSNRLRRSTRSCRNKFYIKTISKKRICMYQRQCFVRFSPRGIESPYVSLSVSMLRFCPCYISSHVKSYCFMPCIVSNCVSCLRKDDCAPKTWLAMFWIQFNLGSSLILLS